MIPLAWTEVEELRLGRLDGGRAGHVITGIDADSREVGPGDLFVALNTGVRYVDEARARGAATLVPDDQEAALAALATLVRSKSAARVVAVVGSAGKTTTKDILGALCEPHASTIWAERSLNNEIGLPLTVCTLEPETAILVTEMGMRGLGQIAALCAIALPEIAVVSHIGPEHRAASECRAGGRSELRGHSVSPAGGYGGGARALPGARAISRARRRHDSALRSR